MTTRIVEFPEFTQEQLRVHQAGKALHRDGASPAGALDLLAAIVEDHTWEQVADPHGRLFTTFRDFVTTKSPWGLGYTVEQLEKVLLLTHPHEPHLKATAERMDAMRAEVRRLLKLEIPTAPPAVHAGPGRGNKTDGGISGFKPNQADTILARLKRDRPDLADRVVNGEVTANAAAREMGWRKPRVLVSSPESVAAGLRRHMTKVDLARLVELLRPE